MKHERGNNGASGEWWTPPEILKALGPFDLDPCAGSPRPWDTASGHYDGVNTNGLHLPWYGRVWLNPPYGGGVASRWVGRLVEHGNGIALLSVRTDAEWFQRLVLRRADALFFIAGRLAFHRPDGSQVANNPTPNVLAAYGDENVLALRESGLEGSCFDLRAVRMAERTDDGRERRGD